MPHTIDLNKELIEYKRHKCKNIWQYFENIDTIYSEMPNNLTGKLYKRKDVVDIMDSSPYFLSLDYVITEKVKMILEELGIDRSEYILKEIQVEHFNDKFYLMFIPIQRIENLIDFKNSYFECDDEIVSFANYSEYFEESGGCMAKKLSIPKAYTEKDIFSLQGCDVFFSERVINCFKTANVVGYDIEEGYFKTDLEFY